MYISHRFPMGGLWWPASGEDIHVEDLGTLPGKAVLLETKVPELLPDDTHITTIDLAQLRKYVATGLPVYYVLPEPPWDGTLITSGWLGPERRADLAYLRSGRRWFGKWTYVCLASDLLSYLSPEIDQKTASLRSLSRLKHWSWREFWSEMARCGADDMPSIFILPSDGSDPPSATLTRSDLRAALQTLVPQVLDLPRVRPREQLGNNDEFGVRSRKRYPDTLIRDLRRADKRYYLPATESQTGEMYVETAAGTLVDSLYSISRALTSDGQQQSALSVCAISFNNVV